MAERDRAAVDVDLVEGEAHVLDEAEHDGRERLVDLDEVDVVDGQPGLGERLAGGGRGPVSMMVGSEPETAAETIRARGVSP